MMRISTDLVCLVLLALWGVPLAHLPAIGRMRVAGLGWAIGNRGEAPKVRLFLKELNTAMADLAIDPVFAQRNVNEGFSGGEKKRHEILQMELLDPKIAILDETDSGLDIDALKVVADGVNRYRAKEGHGVLLITHYTRILRYVQPDFVHVFVGGRIVREGGPELAEQLETSGYEEFVKAGAAS